MRKAIIYFWGIIAVVTVSSIGCSENKDKDSFLAANSESLKKSLVAEKVNTQEISADSAKIDDEELYCLPVVAGKASSFDETPDWAPAPNPMAPVDGDMLTRWSSNYENEEEWIYFDLDQERIVSNIIVRWERAYAKKYKIFVSMDAEDWQEVFFEQNGQGGDAEAFFPPVKCRYLKIMSVEKAEADWGISIWEVEIYGPKGQNIDAQISKKDYLARGNTEAKRKEADEAISKLSEAVPSLEQKPFQQGVVYTSWMSDELLMPVSDFTLISLKEKGIDTISIMVPAYQDALNSEVIFTNDRPGGDTPTDIAITHAIETCHKLGMRVLLKPHVDPRTNEARIDIVGNQKWFDSYEEFILRYAKIAALNNVEIFSIGTELEGTTFEAWTSRWEIIIKKVREVYKGKLVYSANWTEYQGVPFWKDMDYLGIDAYFPLTDKNDATREELISAWEKKAGEIETWLRENNLLDKPVLFTEIGYTTTDGTNRQPWVALTSIEDQQEQSDCLDAAFEVLTKKPWFKGYYLWQYMPQERWSPLGFTVNGKKAENIFCGWVKKIKESENLNEGGKK
ncbi:protein containing Coagulation factor 5/8 type [Candidatus Omnitrophus magneticus]|uniref:Protein containing Coagulation factor 5/8 type n=1 Tax=Candidatus Omnitrophus magneticus TaxID=1609969 RepID=A0A0F0CUX2_9BACT|nr:protein containing Coagulation factor 5/8 type [Candidatus Omnitrophus magneticus]